MAGSALAAAVQSGFEDRTRHKIALRLLPFLFTLYIVNYVDRTNLGFAAIGMARDLGFSDRVFGLGAGIFLVSYMALQIPGALTRSVGACGLCGPSGPRAFFIKHAAAPRSSFAERNW